MIRASRQFFPDRRRAFGPASLIIALAVTGCSPEGTGAVKLPPPGPAAASASTAKPAVPKPGRRAGVYQGPDGRKG